MSPNMPGPVDLGIWPINRIEVIGGPRIEPGKESRTNWSYNEAEPRRARGWPCSSGRALRFSRTSTANAADDYAHRGQALQTMPYYVYTAHVRVLAKGIRLPSNAHIFQFEDHYIKSKSHIQVVRLTSRFIPTIDGFQCPTWQQDAEQNSLLMSLLFFPWSCTDPFKCNCTSKFKQLLSNGNCQGSVGDAPQHAAASSAAGASQPAETPARRYTFERAWRLRWCEIKVRPTPAHPPHTTYLPPPANN